MNFQQTLSEIQVLLTSVNHDSDLFVQALNRQHIFHLSFSQISTVEFCPYRYYLQYILYQQPEPMPDYFTKGKLLHEIIARFYQAQKEGEDLDLSDIERAFPSQLDQQTITHIGNALQLHQQNNWCEVEVVAVEHPFVFSLSEQLPPIVGIIDLVLRRDDQIILVDHKTGRNFYPYDELQVAIYSHYIKHAYTADSCRLFYDHYRWVNHLERIRKPAFQRTEVCIDPNRWHSYLERIENAAEKIHQLRAGEAPAHSSACFRCPYRTNCTYSYQQKRS